MPVIQIVILYLDMILLMLVICVLTLNYPHHDLKKTQDYIGKIAFKYLFLFLVVFFLTPSIPCQCLPPSTHLAAGCTSSVLHTSCHKDIVSSTYKGNDPRYVLGGKALVVSLVSMLWRGSITDWLDLFGTWDPNCVHRFIFLSWPGCFPCVLEHSITITPTVAGMLLG